MDAVVTAFMAILAEWNTAALEGLFDVVGI